jgi:predicted transcriptional regulator
MVIANVPIHEELMTKLMLIASKQHKEHNWIINEAVKEYVEREEYKQQKLEETKEGLADIQAGRVVDGEEVMAWLASWGTENELEQLIIFIINIVNEINYVLPIAIYACYHPK